MGGCGSKPKTMEDTVGLPVRAPQKQNNKVVERPTRKLRTDVKVRDAYKMGKTLGTGGFAVVKLGTDRQTGEEFAIKIMALPEVGKTAGDNENTREDIFKEIDILIGMDHENVIFMKEYYEEGNKVYLITELLTGGELLDAVLEKGSYSEADARLCFVQLLRGIEYLHSRGVVHRDLKLENLLLTTPEDITHVKIADFGLAKKAAESAMNTICGTPQYVAPEVIQGTPGLIYSPAVDLWSAGVVLFILLGGYPPFYDESEPALFNQIRKGAFTFDDPVWDTVTDSAKDLIRALLTTDPDRRLNATQALAHEWCSQPLTQTPHLNLDKTRLNMHKTVRKKFKGAVHMIVAQNRMARLTAGAKAGEQQPRELADGSSPEEIAHFAEAAKRLEMINLSLKDIAMEQDSSGSQLGAS